MRKPDTLKLKVCGMKHNPEEVARLAPDYLGFIFWEGSQRNWEGPPPTGISHDIVRVGVFVDGEISSIVAKCREFRLGAVQLHGNESAAYIGALREALQEAIPETAIIKAFAVGPDFEFTQLSPYLPIVDFFLFDSQGPLPGGNGTQFNWHMLESYPFDKPYFLSGGIGPGSLEELRSFASSNGAQSCYAVDVNSKFETEPGRKDIPALQGFLESGFSGG